MGKNGCLIDVRIGDLDTMRCTLSEDAENFLRRGEVL